MSYKIVLIFFAVLAALYYLLLVNRAKAGISCRRLIQQLHPHLLAALNDEKQGMPLQGVLAAIKLREENRPLFIRLCQIEEVLRKAAPGELAEILNLAATHKGAVRRVHRLRWIRRWKPFAFEEALQKERRAYEALAYETHTMYALAGKHSCAREMARLL